jgi:hypothetical protein
MEFVGVCERGDVVGVGRGGAVVRIFADIEISLFAVAQG